jgi:hypothetical protein
MRLNRYPLLVLLALVGLLLMVTAGPWVTSAHDADRGKFFTLGFKGRDATFVILAREQRVIHALRADLAKPRRERRIVSGIVRPRRGYNRPWSYTMGSRSIIVAEVFVEVCDASPAYVENHREDWLGKRWCPWSSYVKRAGR